MIVRFPRAAVPRRAVLCLVPVLLLVGCGQDRATTTGGDASTPTVPSPTDTATDTATEPRPDPANPSEQSDPTGPTGGPTTADLAVTWGDGAGAGATWTLTCDPAAGPAGDHPDPAAACAALPGAATALDPLPRDVACTEIYGGPQTATVTGTLAGSPVTAELSRTNGCEIARWDALVPLLPPATTGT